MRLINHLLVFFVTFFLFFTSTSFVMASEINRNPTQMELEKNIKLRKTLGFDINRNHVLSILNDENKEERFSYGFTKEEAKEFDRRMKFQKDEVPKIKQKVFEKINENNIGSFYIDQKNNGKLILGITVGTPKSTIEKIKKEINELTTESENVEFIFVENSLIELEELRDKIIEESGNLLNQNIKILDITLNMKFNKLVIGVEDNNSYVTNTLKNLYGEKRIDVIKVSPLQNDSRTDYYYTLQGGLRIVSENKDSCTSNVTVYDSKNKYYLLTAGHCSKVGVKWTQGGKDIGTMVSRIYSGNTDAAIISMDSGRKGKYIYAHKPSDIKISGVQSLSGETVGDIVCKAGATTGFSCGELLDKNYSVYDLTQWWKGLRKASYSSAGGDSGAPVITTNATNYLIVGIHKGKDNSNGYTIYTHIQNALNNLGGLKVYY